MLPDECKLGDVDIAVGILVTGLFDSSDILFLELFSKAKRGHVYTEFVVEVQ